MASPATPPTAPTAPGAASPFPPSGGIAPPGAGFPAGAPPGMAGMPPGMPPPGMSGMPPGFGPPGMGGPPGMSGPPGMNNFPGGPAMGGFPGGQKPDMKKINPYIYAPSFSMAVVGSMGFLILSGFHLFQLFKYKSWYFGIVTQGVIVAAAAMIARTHSIITLKETGATGAFPIFMMMDMVGPTVLVIGNVFTMTRVIWWVTPNERRNLETLKAPPRMMSFMWVGMFSIADLGKAVGQHVFKPMDPMGMKFQEVGQVLQFFILFGYFLWAYRFMTISRRWMIHGQAEEKRWRNLGWTCVAVAALIAFRWMFTVVGMDARTDPRGFFSQHEWVMWVTEELPIFIAYALYNISFPGAFLPREYTHFRLKTKQLEKSKLESPWPITISSPIRSHEDDKGVEITLTELENGRMDGRSHPAHR